MKSIVLAICFSAICISAFSQEATYWSAEPYYGDESSTRIEENKPLPQPVKTMSGDVISFKQGIPDTTFVEDPITGEIYKMVRPSEPVVEKINGGLIYEVADVNAAKQNTEVLDALVAITEEVKESTEMNTARYTFTNITVNDKGRVIYLDLNITNIKNVTPEVNAAIAEKILLNLARITVEPVMSNGKPVAFRTSFSHL